jgi:integrase
MASLSTYPNDVQVVQFVFGGKRRTVSLGRMKIEKAKEVQANIEFILQDKLAGRAHEPDMRKWLKSISDKLHGKLAKCGLIEPRKKATLGQWIDHVIDRDQKAKPGSKEVWRQGKLGLIEFFGTDRPLADLTAGQGDDYLNFLKAKPIKSRAHDPADAGPVKTLSPMTVRKRLQFAKKVFRAALRHQLIDVDPFADVTIKAAMPNRMRFITREETDKLLAACPGQDWRTIIVLARYGGLRCPSEVLSLTWETIDWDKSRITVTSPKTAHHPGHETRTCPLFPELRNELEAIWTPDASGYIVDQRYHDRANGPQGWRNVNLRTTFEKIIKRAGLTPWPRMFHNLRSSRQTELERLYPTHVVCAWLGNSPDIAREHYLQVTDTDFERAAGGPENFSANSVQYGAVSDRSGSCDELAAVEIPDDYDGLLTCTTVQSDGEGFEPTVDFRPRRFSRPVP